MAQAANHIHRLKKHKYNSGQAVFFCTLKDCHYKVEVPFALGKESICNICGSPFIMNEYTLKLIRPHCPNCGRKEVKDSDGRKHYVKKRSSQILSSIADESADDLRSRLQNAISVTKEEDI